MWHEGLKNKWLTSYHHKNATKTMETTITHLKIYVGHTAREWSCLCFLSYYPRVCPNLLLSSFHRYALPVNSFLQLGLTLRPFLLIFERLTSIFVFLRFRIRETHNLQGWLQARWNGAALWNLWKAPQRWQTKTSTQNATSVRESQRDTGGRAGLKGSI